MTNCYLCYNRVHFTHHWSLGSAALSGNHTLWRHFWLSRLESFCPGFWFHRQGAASEKDARSSFKVATSVWRADKWTFALICILLQNDASCLYWSLCPSHHHSEDKGNKWKHNPVFSLIIKTFLLFPVQYFHYRWEIKLHNFLCCAVIIYRNCLIGFLFHSYRILESGEW